MSSSPTPPQSSPRSSSNHTDPKKLIGNFATVARIMKTALPDNAKIAKEAKECMQECVSEFISFITSEGMSTDANVPGSILTWTFSIGEMPARKEKNRQRRGYHFRHDITRLRELFRGSTHIPGQISRGTSHSAGTAHVLKPQTLTSPQSNLGKAEGQQPGHGRSSTPGQQGQTSSGDEREEAVSGVIGATVPSAVPGGGMAPSFGGAQESDPTGAAAGVSYAYPAMSNGGSGTY